MEFSQAFVQKQPLGPNNSGGYSKVAVYQRLIFKVTIYLSWLGIMLVIIDRWTVFEGGR
jgi:hypothetical protein